MKAYNIQRYGDPEAVVKVTDMERPIPTEKEVLVRVACSAINDYDWCLSTGTPFSYRVFFGLAKPKKKMRIPGMEVAGTVEGVGNAVKTLNVGDRVYGDTSDHGFGSLAEYMTLNEAGLRQMPDGMSFREGVCFPHASALAMQGLIDLGKICQGEKVLINGGGGGVGMLGLQIAKTFGAHVTGVDAAIKLEQMRELGYDETIDFCKEDFTKNGKRYDLILDCRTSRWPGAHLRALKPEGRYVSIGGHSGKLMATLLYGKIIGLFAKKKLLMVSVKANKDLPEVEKLFAEEKLKPVIDGPYSFAEAPKAIKRFGEAGHIGKVVVRVS